MYFYYFLALAVMIYFMFKLYFSKSTAQYLFLHNMLRFLITVGVFSIVLHWFDLVANVMSVRIVINPTIFLNPLICFLNKQDWAIGTRVIVTDIYYISIDLKIDF